MFKSFLPFYFKTKRIEFFFGELEIKHLKEIINGRVWYRQLMLNEDEIGYHYNKSYFPVPITRLQTNNPLLWSYEGNFFKRLFLNAIELKVITKKDLEETQGMFSPSLNLEKLDF